MSASVKYACDDCCEVGGAGAPVESLVNAVVHGSKSRRSTVDDENGQTAFGRASDGQFSLFLLHIWIERRIMVPG